MPTPYRDDLEALRAELTDLESELCRAQARREALASAAAEEEVLRERIERLRKRVREGTRRALPFLNEVRVATPCTASWDEMVGDERSRFCAGCQKDVFDLSGMSGEQAEAFVRERAAIPEKTCIRFYRRTDGTVMTNDCPTGVARRRRRVVAGMAVGAGVAAAGVAYALGVGQTKVTMGELEALPPVAKIEIQGQPPAPPQLMMGEMEMPRRDAKPGATGKSPGKR